MIASLPTWPLNSPGMPPPGPDFLNAAVLAGDRESAVTKGGRKADTRVVVGRILQRLYDQALRRPGFTLQVATRGGTTSQVELVPGHIWKQHSDEFVAAAIDPNAERPQVDGPHPAKVMVLTKMVAREETFYRRQMMGPTGEQLVASLQRTRTPNFGDWYVTSLCKFNPPDGSTRIASNWMADCLPLLHMELRLVRPSFILCLGAEAAKAILGRKASVGSLDGRVADWEYVVSRDGEPVERQACTVMVAINPVQVTRDEPMRRTLDRSVSRFSMLVGGVRFDKAEGETDHRRIDSYEDACKWFEDAKADVLTRKKPVRFVAWDAEWQGRNPYVPHGYLRTIQVSWAAKKAVVFRLRDENGKVSFRDSRGREAENKLKKLLDRFCRETECRSVGHFFNADLEWFRKYGFDPTKYGPIPLYDDEKGRRPWEQLRAGNGYFDTALMAHAVEETAMLGLEALTTRYTTAPRYDVPLDKFLDEFCDARKIKRKSLRGFGEIPDNVLIGTPLEKDVPYGQAVGDDEYPSYAAYDADVTRRLAVALWPLLDKDHYGQPCWEPFWDSMSTQGVIAEMRRNGILLDRKRVEHFTVAFLETRNDIERQLREWANWPSLNVRSVYQIRELLFGERYNGHDWVDGMPVRIRPPGAMSAGLTPITDTSKPARRWEEIVAAGEERRSSPSTAKSSLAILAIENENHPAVVLTRDYRFLDQVVKQTLRPPTGEAGSGRDSGDDGEGDNLGDGFDYDGGIMACLDGDGRVRTTMLPVTETGRWLSRAPNLQNQSKSRDKDYARLLGDRYTHKLRSIFVASPGCALIEFDYVGAELAMLAFLSGDTAMIDHISRANLPESDEQHYDIHSNIAVKVFRLGCRPLKSEMEKAKIGHFRTLAKNVVFGLIYGRSAKAIALQARETRKPGEPEFSGDDAQAVIDAFYEMYPRTRPFLDSCAARATNPRWMKHAFGRSRRFPEVRDRAIAGEFERQCKNFPIQGGVASAVNRGLNNMVYLRDNEYRQPDLFRMLLQIHDAGLVEAPYEHVELVADTVIPAAMVDGVPIYPADLNGRPTGRGPYRLGVEVTVMPRWGEKYTRDECEKLGIPTRFAAK